MSKDMVWKFVTEHRREYTCIGNYAKKHNIVVGLGEYPNVITVSRSVPEFSKYMKRNQKDFTVVVVEG